MSICYEFKKVMHVKEGNTKWLERRKMSKDSINDCQDRLLPNWSFVPKLSRQREAIILALIIVPRPFRLCLLFL